MGMITIDPIYPNFQHIGYFIMTIGGETTNGDVLDDVELVPVDPIFHPVPDCLTQLNSLPEVTKYTAGALDYSSM